MQRAIYSLFLVLICVFIVSTCTEKYPSEAEKSRFLKKESSCVSCHTDADLLKEVAEPLPPPSGESGET